MWQPAERYPDPAIVSLDASFDRYRLFHAAVERLYTGARWSEGPVWFGDARHLVWSDIPNDRMLKWDEETGQVAAFRAPSGYANGNTRDHQGRLVTCEQGGRRVTRTEPDGTVTVLVDSIAGRRLNSPNDVVVKSDGSIWFTDPVFGIQGDYEGRRAAAELPQNVYRLRSENGTAEIVATDIAGPNGLCFSPDESVFYLVESRAEPHRRIIAYDVAGSTLTNRRVFVDAGAGGTPDGIRCDTDGNLWCGWGMGSDALDGVMVFNPDGRAIGRIRLPERCANLCFGGRARNRLFMAASRSLYALYVNTQGVAGG